MIRFVLLLMVLLSGVHPVAAQQHVEARGITSAIKLEEIIFGHLVELKVSSNYEPPKLRLPQMPTWECITILVRAFAM